jgi:hypothetical protein
MEIEWNGSIFRLSPAISFKFHPLHPSFTEFSTRFSPLYLISLQQRSLNLVLYTLNPILETYFVPILYIRIYHTSNAMDIFYFYLIQCLKRKEK